MDKAPRVVCLGGGYVASFLCRALQDAVADGRLDLTVISRDNFHVFHGLVAEMLVGKIEPTTIISSVRRLFAPARFLNAEIEEIDLSRQTVTVSRSLDGRQYVVPYDHLVLGLGSIDDLSTIPGVAEHALRLRSYSDCFRTRNHLLTMLELAELEEDPEERRKLLTFVVAGGNFAGIEVATELVDYLHIVPGKYYQNIDPTEVRVVVVHGGDGILPELRRHHPGLVRYAERHLDSLRRLGLELKLNTRLVAATSEEAVLSGGEHIPTRTIISCIGTAQSPLLDTLPFERDGRGRVITDQYCRVLGTTNVWAGGDCAAVPDPRGGTAPMLATYAMYTGRRIARNILRIIDGQEPERFGFTGIGDAVSLGQRKAASHLREIIPAIGLPSWLIWRFFMFLYLPTRDRKVRLLTDWLLAPLLGRDIVRIRLDERRGVEAALYEPGQIIVKQGDIGQHVYVVQSGEVEVVQETPEGEHLLAVLGPGDHFGETAVFERVRRTATVRARDRVRLLVLGREEAISLSETVEPFGQTIRKVPYKPVS